MFPLLFRDCPLDCHIILTLLDKNMKPFAVTSVALFNSDSTLRYGNQKVEFYADDSLPHSTIPYDCGHREVDDYLKWQDISCTNKSRQYGWLEELTEEQFDQITSVSIDRKKKYLEALGRKLYNRKFSLPAIPRGMETEVNTNEIHLEMTFCLPYLTDTIYHDLEYHRSIDREDRFALINAGAMDFTEVPCSPSSMWEDFDMLYYDPEVGLENPVDEKVNKLKQSTARKFYSPDAKPTNAEKTLLLRVIGSTKLPSELADEERDLLWTYRHVVYGVRHALPKILYAMDLSLPSEAHQAEAMLEQWPQLPVEDALQLLGKEIRLPAARAYAVSQLDQQLTDEDLELFLLQLVQALRYEEDPYRKEEKQITVERVIRMVKQKSSEVSPATLSDESPLHSEPENEAVDEPSQSANKEVSLSSEGGMIDGSELSNSIVEATTQPANSEPKPEPEPEPETEPEVIDDVIEGTIQEVQTVTVITPVSPLLQFLVNRCSVKRSLASLFIRYLRVEATTKGNDSDNAKYADMESCFLSHLKDQPDSSVYEAIQKEDRIVEILFGLSDRISELGGRAQKKQENLQLLLSRDYREVLSDHPLLPIRPELPLSHVLPSTAKVFQSAMTPCRLEFIIEGSERGVISVRSLRRDSVSTASDGEGNKNLICKSCGDTYARCTCIKCVECGGMLVNNKHHCRDCRYPVCGKCSELRNNERHCKSQDNCDKRTHLTLQVMVKNGDDVRQDQMVMQMIRLMNKLLNNMNLDLCLSPYAVLAISSSQGMLEMVQNSKALSGVKSIRAFLKECAPTSNKEEINPQVMDTYIRSCAGYAVITYLLGIGDRHLDNIMIDDKGHFFHIDFGYIFGQDPKVKEASIRITNDMIDGMGGKNSKNYQLFLGYAFQAYHILRQNALLLITLLRLMLDANIKDCKPEFLDRMIARFNLSMTDEEAESDFKRVLEGCIGDIFVGMLEIAHNIATAMR